LLKSASGSQVRHRIHPEAIHQVAISLELDAIKAGCLHALSS
jgi:hypothetical protein